MIRLTSIQQALSLRGTIPELAVIRSMQFMSDGYSTDDGWIVVLEQGDDINQIKEVGPNGLFDDDVPIFEYVEAFVDGDQVTFELVYQLDDSRTVAVIADAICLDDDLRSTLLELSPPQLLPRKALENTLV
jgi:hypothetical protein